MEKRMDIVERTASRRERGSALFVAVMMLVLMGFLGLAALERVGSDEQIAGYQTRARTAFYAAQAGVAEARTLVKDPATLTSRSRPFHTQAVPETIGDVALYDREEGNLPRYYGDAGATNVIDDTEVLGPIGWIGRTTKPPEGWDIRVGGRAPTKSFWQMTVIGESPDGSSSRQQGVAIRMDVRAGY
jgi:hypothetical protein